MKKSENPSTRLDVLHAWGTGSTNILNKWQILFGHNSTVVMRKLYDPFLISSYYNAVVVPGHPLRFYQKALWMARHVDIIHLHDLAKRISVWRHLYTKKPLILHYHGSLTRDTPFKTRSKWESCADVLLLSTPDLLEYKYLKPPTYLPNPIDTELFAPRVIQPNNRGLVLMKKGQTSKETLSLLREHGFGDIDWEVRERGSTLVHNNVRNTLYRDMPDKLSQYEWYGDINIINGKLTPAHSVTGLQAMSLGLKTIDYNFEIYNTLPTKHKPENVVKKLNLIYTTALETKRKK